MKTNQSKVKSPLLWVPSMYFGMGLPNIMVCLVAVIMFSEMGIDNTKVTLWTSFFGIIWAIKPLWSPFLEMFKTKKYFVVGTQMITGIGFALVALCLPLPNFFTYTIALMCLVAFSGATHDIAADGVYMTELDTQTQAKYIGWQGAFFNIAKVFGNGGLVYLAGVLKDTMGIINTWVLIMGMVAVVMILLSLWHARILPSGGAAATKITSAKEGWDSFKTVFVTFFQKKYIWMQLAFILLYRLAEGLAIKVLPLFLKDSIENGGLGLQVSEVGLINGGFGAFSFILGSIVGGYFVSRKGLKNNMLLLCCAINLPFLLYLLLAILQPSSIWLIGTTVVCEYFGFGFGTIGLTLFMMQQIAPGAHKMAHYAFASGIVLLSYNLAGMISGYLSDLVGYKWFFVIVGVAMIPVIILSRIVPFSHPDRDEPEEEILSEEIK